MDFKEIKTQEELDAIIKTRIAREREKYQDYETLKSNIEKLQNENTKLKTDLNSATANTTSYTEKINELETQIKNHELSNIKTKVALQYGLPLDLVGRLNGNNEDELKTDAEMLSSFIKKNQYEPQFKSNEPSQVDEKTIALKQVIKNLTTKGE